MNRQIWLLATLLLLVVPPNFAIAGKMASCPGSLLDEGYTFELNDWPVNHDALSELTLFETKLDHFMNSLLPYMHRPSAVFAWEKTSTLKEELHQSLDKLLEQDLRQSRLYESLRKKFFAIHQGFILHHTRKQTQEWADLKENPNLIEAGRVYEVTFASDGSQIEIVFTDEIVENFFRTDNEHRSRAGKKFLAAIERGFARSKGQSGIEAYSGYDNIYSIKILGRSMSFRLGGRISKGRLTLVHFVEGGDHSSSNWQQKYANAIINKYSKLNTSH